MISFLRNEKSGYRRNEKFTPYLLSTSVIYLIIAAHIRLLKKVLVTNSTVTKQLIPYQMDYLCKKAQYVLKF